MKKLFNRKKVKYTISSLGSSLIELVLFYLMTSILFPNIKNIILIATISARIIGTIINFIVNKYWCFEVKNRTLIQSIEFFILFCVKLYLSYFFVNMLVNKTGWNATLIKIPIDVTLFFVGYVVQNFIIFKKTS